MLLKPLNKHEWEYCLLSKGRSRSSPPYLCHVGIGLEEDRTDTSFTSVSSRPKFFSLGVCNYHSQPGHFGRIIIVYTTL